MTKSKITLRAGKLLILVILLLVTVSAFAQVDNGWVRRYNGPGNYGDEAFDIAVDGSGYVYVTGWSYSSGTSYDYATIKYYPNGDISWARRYNGPGNSDDQATAIAVDGSGNVYVTGYSYNSGTYLDYDYATIKYYPNGDTAWVRRYNGSGNLDDQATAIAVDGYGNVYVTGWSYSSGTSYDYATIKYYPNGDIYWMRRYNGPGNSYDYAKAMAVDSSGNVYVTGMSYGSGARMGYATIKYYPNGDTAWVRRYNGSENSWDNASAIAVDGFGNVYVTGGSDLNTGASYDYATIRYYPNGDTAWVRRYNVGGYDCPQAMAVDGSGNVYVTGFGGGSGPWKRYATIKYYPNGDTAWVMVYKGQGIGDDWASAVAVDGSGNVFVTGTTCFTYEYGADYATIKYYPNGDISWVRRYNGPGNSDDQATAIAVDGSGNVFVTGGSYGSGTYYDYATIKNPQYLSFDTSGSLLPGWKFSISTGSCWAGVGVSLWANWVELWRTVCHYPENIECSGEGVIPSWATELEVWVDDGCHPAAGDFKLVAASWENGRWVIHPLGSWVQLNIGKSELEQPFVTDTLPGFDTIYAVVNLETWITDPRPSQDTYMIVSGTCPELPGFLFGTTPIVFDSMAGPNQNPFSTTPLTGTLYLRGKTGVIANFVVCGDANGSGLIELGDVVYLITYLYKNGPAPDPLLSGDANCSGEVELGDVVYLITYLYKGGPAPSCK